MTSKSGAESGGRLKHRFRPRTAPMMSPATEVTLIRSPAAKWSITIGFSAFLIYLLARQWSDIRPLFSEMTWTSLLFSSLLVAVGVFFGFLAWCAVMRDVGGHLGMARAAEVYFVGQLGKYLPGSVWPVLTQMELARSHDVPRRATAVATTVVLVITLLTGAVVGLLAAPWLSPESAERFVWLWVPVPALLAALHPPILNRLLGWVLRVVRQSDLPSNLTYGGILPAVWWLVLVWGVFGLHLLVLSEDLGVDLPVIAAIGIFAASWSAGFIFFVSPAGLGAREGALVALLSVVTGGPHATLIALSSRLVFSLVDLVAGLAAASQIRAHSRADRSSLADDG